MVLATDIKSLRDFFHADRGDMFIGGKGFLLQTCDPEGVGGEGGLLKKYIEKEKYII